MSDAAPEFPPPDKLTPEDTKLWAATLRRNQIADIEARAASLEMESLAARFAVEYDLSLGNRPGDPEADRVDRKGNIFRTKGGR